jgi:glycosyltransferase involved in cell wall biosynthesis
MRPPTLGVLITYFNERELLTECLRGLLESHEGPDEVLVYDDASEAPAVDFVPPDSRLRVIRGVTNVGPSRGRNRLLAESQSEYVHFHDADDLFDPQWGSKVRAAIVSGVDVVFTEVACFENGRLVSERTLGLRRLRAGSDLIAFALEGSILVPGGTYRRARVATIGGYRETLWQSEDFDFHVRLAASGVTYVVIDEPLVRTRVRPEGRSQRRREVWTSYLEAVKALAVELEPRYRPLLADGARRAGVTLLELGARAEAFDALDLADRVGPGTFSGKAVAYRGLARILGVARTERLAWAYRHSLPAHLRRWVRDRRLLGPST